MTAPLSAKLPTRRDKKRRPLDRRDLGRLDVSERLIKAAPRRARGAAQIKCPAAATISAGVGRGYLTLILPFSISILASPLNTTSPDPVFTVQGAEP
jgi:hypothetical protein